jgi:hypothetical protein
LLGIVITPLARRALACAAVALVAAMAPLAQQETPKAADAATLTSLEVAASALARSGRASESTELIGVLDALGYDKEKVAKLTKACNAEASKAKPSTEALSDAARRLRAAAKQLDVGLTRLDGEAKRDLARAILRLDDGVEDAHAALGHVKDGNAWISADEKKCRARRAEIAAALQSARHLEFDIDVSESREPLLAEIYGRPGVQAKWKDCTFHAPYSAEKTTRILREAFRACAFSRYLRDGKLSITEKDVRPTTRNWILINSKERYTKAIEVALREGWLDAPRASEARELSGFFDKRGCALDFSPTEGEALSVLLTHFMPLKDGAQSCLKAGHFNWVSMACFGVSIPGWAWTETSGAGSGGPVGDTSVAESAAEKKEREERVRMARGGIVGCRSYMTYVVEHGKDPPWSRSMVDQFGKISGEDLLKSTSVVECLQELDLFPALISATDAAGTEHWENLYAKALGGSLPAFEMRWRAWLLPMRAGLVQRIEHASAKTGAKSANAGEDELLRGLNKLRTLALKSIDHELRDVTCDASLSDGARLHAAYLNRHTEQAAAWPDAHEEYADHEGFTPAGAWAGGHGVIHPKVKSAQEALDGWMGTFYHRLPLIDPGLMRVGWGFEKGCAVLDVTSLCAPPDKIWTVVWPYDGMTSVPTSFSPELPNPVPGQDQSRLGYPITLQVGAEKEDEQSAEVVMKLFDDKTEVPCYFSSPNHPTNVELAPGNAYCLIPKSALKPKTQYTVRADWVGTAKKLSWSFRT